MKAIKIKYMYCWCPARLKTKTDNKRDTGVSPVLSSFLPPHKVHGFCSPDGKCGGAGWVAHGCAE